MNSEMGRFAIALMGKLGPAMFSATLVGCLLSGRFEVIHGVLLAVASICISVEYVFSQRQ